MISKNDMMMVNDLIYKIHTIDDFNSMRSSVLTSLKLLIPYDVVTFSIASPDNPYELCDAVSVGLPEDRWKMYEDEFQAMDYTRWTFAAPIAKAYRETDLMNDETRISTPYYQQLFVPSNIHYSAILTLIKNETFYGCINIFRKKDDGDFTDIEMTILDMLKDHLSYRLYKAKESYSASRKLYPDKEFLMDNYQLTRREIEILFLLLDGIDRDSISNQLSISPNTLKKHTANIYRKTSVNNYRELIKLMENLPE